ncbi:hypothetical protein ACFLZP_03375 [Patescibacteria group bacterium]
MSPENRDAIRKQDIRQIIVDNVRGLVSSHPDKFAVVYVPSAQVPNFSAVTLVTLNDGSRFEVSAGLEFDRRRPAQTIHIKEEKRPVIIGGQFYRLDISRGPQIIHDLVHFGDQGRTFEPNQSGEVVEWSDDWADTNISAEKAFNILSQVENVELPSWAHGNEWGDPRRPTLTEFLDTHTLALP